MLNIYLESFHTKIDLQTAHNQNHLSPSPEIPHQEIANQNVFYPSSLKITETSIILLKI